MQKTPAFSARTLGPVSDLERHLPPDWWKSLFNSIYIKTDADVVENRYNTERETDIIVDKLKLRESDAILDLCCGQGRHAIELAKRGFRHITGLDRSRYLVRLARKRARDLGVPIQFSEGDIRDIRMPESSQDCAYIMGNSFGYFEREEDDMGVLNSVIRVLKSEGRLAIDILNGDWVRQHFDPRSWEWIDQNQFVCRERSLSNDKQRIVSREVVVHAEKGVMTDQFYAERLYSQNEIMELLARAGFGDIRVDGEIIPDSHRNEDLGLMGNRLFITAVAPKKAATSARIAKPQEVTVIMGDPRMPDKVKKDGVFNEEDLATIQRLKDSLNQLKQFKFRYYDNHGQLQRHWMSQPPEFVLNLCDEGFKNVATMELHVTALMDMLNIPYSGAGPTCLGLCYNKSWIRAIAADIDVPVPDETYFDPSDQAAALPSIFPALIKPNMGDSSVGITKDAVVHNAEQLIAYIKQLSELFPGAPLLVQEYLQGKEYSVGLIGNPGYLRALPLLEVDFSKLPKDLPQILSYESKWDPDSPYWTSIGYKEAELDEERQRKLIDHSIKLFERTGCRDYARFDFRADKDGAIKLLEVNPNPGWCWDGKLNLMAGFQGMEYHELLECILKAAHDRCEQNTTH